MAFHVAFGVRSSACWTLVKREAVLVDQTAEDGLAPVAWFTITRHR
jgi:hypothetical protein